MDSSTSANKILNTGLEFAMEFGPNWLKPIQDRLHASFPSLTTQTLDEYNETCRDVMFKGHEFIYKQLEATANGGHKINLPHWKRCLETFYQQLIRG
ncbi:hypothetical protein [Pseudochryseolinea flava]|uniref:Uncharacterized protein n=1 Tax=Pseudochryseolinea flava TaxID=2059302 RepID=A0A364XXV2_9BACT|nr:hypothetical protein [Pseudochryseolinea flava]RAV99240.1 hypothetical protein DQQ10_20300 [Pseudochryseolinea flava]